MIRRAKAHPLEVTATTGALVLFAAACGWSAWTILDSLVAGSAAIAAGAAIAALAIRQLGRPVEPPFAIFAMESLTIGDDEGAGARLVGDELLLDDILLPDTLWLDDPVPSAETDSRVVRLFAGDPATPGELVERISDFLVDKAATPTLAGPPVQPAPDASAELYAALANIRASLR